jgi:hypothetical protein
VTDEHEEPWPNDVNKGKHLIRPPEHSLAAKPSSSKSGQFEIKQTDKVYKISLS